jgi:hypothetical protein
MLVAEFKLHSPTYSHMLSPENREMSFHKLPQASTEIESSVLVLVSELIEYQLV